jgi:hypothetical protein
MSTDYKGTGVAISTTGQFHRIPFLETCVERWGSALRHDCHLVVTVDGDAMDAERVRIALDGKGADVLWMVPAAEGRRGVAANKNTGIEWLVEMGVEHLFLSDDDAWPTCPGAPDLHRHPGAPPHSMVNWGPHRLDNEMAWTWPRGSVLYAHRSVVDTIGGMIEAFGTGGHEHVEWSRRIFQAGITPFLYTAPLAYAALEGGYGARRFWHCEDMPRPGEHMSLTMARRRRLTSMNREADAAAKSEQIMDVMDGSPRFVPYTAARNGREQAIVVLS